MGCKDVIDEKMNTWKEQADKASKRRGGRSSGWGPGFRTTTFTSQSVGG